MSAYPRMSVHALRLAVPVWVGLLLPGCGLSPIDADRAAFSNPAAIATQEAAQARLSLVHGQAAYGLHVEGAAEAPPVTSVGAVHNAYLRWLNKEGGESSGGGAGGGELPKLSADGE